jgi:pimeloyl-CoA synthetase
MGMKKFFKQVKHLLGLEDFIESEKKKKSIKELLSKLHARKREIKELLKSKLSKKERHELKDELEIISFHIKNGKKILAELYAKK